MLPSAGGSSGVAVLSRSCETGCDGSAGCLDVEDSVISEVFDMAGDSGGVSAVGWLSGAVSAAGSAAGSACASEAVRSRASARLARLLRPNVFRGNRGCVTDFDCCMFTLLLGYGLPGIWR